RLPGPARHLPPVHARRRRGTDQPGTNGRVLRRQRSLRTDTAVLQCLRRERLQPARPEGSVASLRRSPGCPRPLPGRGSATDRGRLRTLGRAGLSGLFDPTRAMRRLSAGIVVVAAVLAGALLALGSGSAGSGDGYTVRAIF